MPAERMCVCRGQGPAVSQSPRIPERAELRQIRDTLETVSLLQQPQGQGCSGLSFLVWPGLPGQGGTSWHQERGANGTRNTSSILFHAKNILLSGMYSSLESYVES